MKLRAIASAVVMAICLSSTAEAKTIAVYGDSYSDYGYYVDNSTTVVNKNDMWWNKTASATSVSRSAGCTVYGHVANAVSTSAHAGYTVSSGTDGKGSIGTLIESNSIVADTYIIEGGLNDVWQGKKLEEFSAGIVQCVNGVRKYNAKAEVYFLMPVGVKGDTAEENAVYTYDYEKYVETAKKTCSELGVRMITVSGFETANWHPTARGMEQMASAVAEEISDGG